MVVMTYCYNVVCSVYGQGGVIRDWDRKRYVTVNFKNRVGRRTGDVNYCGDVRMRTDVRDVELKIVSEMCSERDEIMFHCLAKYFRMELLQLCLGNQVILRRRCWSCVTKSTNCCSLASR